MSSVTLTGVNARQLTPDGTLGCRVPTFVVNGTLVFFVMSEPGAFPTRLESAQVDGSNAQSLRSLEAAGAQLFADIQASSAPLPTVFHRARVDGLAPIQLYAVTP